MKKGTGYFYEAVKSQITTLNISWPHVELADGVKQTGLASLQRGLTRLNCFRQSLVRTAEGYGFLLRF